MRRIPGGPLNANSYLIYSEEGKGILIDAVGEEVLEWTKEIRVKEILLTHGHFDHIFGLKRVLEETKTGYWIHFGDIYLIENFPLKTKKFLGVTPEPIPKPSHTIQEGELFKFRGYEVKAIHTPGHTPGSVCIQLNNWLFTGDTIFNGGVGRTDFEGGSEYHLKGSLRRILELPDDTILFPGHGPRTTIGKEKGYLMWLIEEDVA